MHPAARLCVGMLVLSLTLSACTLSALTRPDEYRVQRGDTLYSVASRYDLDWREVARWNNISSPYTLRVGQVLSLDRYPPVAYSPNSGGASSASKKSTRPAAKSASKSRSRPKAAANSKPAPRLADTSDKDWRWPTAGKLLRTYEQTSPRHGIDIGGQAGDSIVAAESGRVVYSGDGLKGYGKLVIIKHDERFLTAYGFNRRVLVGQGDTVKAGQKIAEMGIGPRNESVLHFELRQDGQPVDPLRLLPSR